MPTSNESTVIRIPERSELVKEVLGRAPSGFIRYGTIFFFVFIGLLIWFSYLVKYPDIIHSRIILTTNQPPVRVVSRANGRIENLYVADKQKIQMGEVMALIESTTQLEDINQLEKFLIQLEGLDFKKDLHKIQMPTQLTLGAMQQQWSSFSEELKDLQYYYATKGINEKQRASLQNQINIYDNLKTANEKQQAVLQREVDLAYKNYTRQQSLYQSGNTSALSLERAESNYLSYKRQVDNLATELLNNSIYIEQLNARIFDLKQNWVNQEISMLIAVKEKIQTMRSGIEEWRYRHVIYAPVSGTISMSGIWTVNQYVTNQQEIFSILTEEEGEVIGKMVMPEFNSGKVAIGQKVIIRLDGYPHQEFGTLTGKVAAVSLVPKDQLYYVDIELPEGLTTTHKESVRFVQEMQGFAEVITEDLRLIHRIFYQILKAFDRTPDSETEEE